MTQEAMKLALEALNDLSAWNDGEVGGHMDEPYAAGTSRKAITAIKEALAEHAMREVQRLGQEIEQEPVAWIEQDIQCDDFDPDSVTCEKPTIATDGWEWVPLYTAPPQRTEQNFCHRCGKRTKDIHTCTPPQEGA